MLRSMVLLAGPLKRRQPVASALALALAIAASAWGCGVDRLCTLMECMDTVTFEVVSGDGRGVDTFSGAAEFDGMTLSFACAAGQRVSSEVAAELTAPSYQCGSTSVVFSNVKAPTLELRVATADGTLSWSGQVKPTYTIFQPNGRACDRKWGCAQAAERIVLAAPAQR
ncbi:MAG: hypothetical protein IPG96_13370 [Proteobacteria bacterium]|nr:hypothetical protein [Pseudomonadota bacterium]